MAKRTRATVALEKAGIPFTLHQYDYDPGEGALARRRRARLVSRRRGRPISCVCSTRRWWKWR